MLMEEADTCHCGLFEFNVMLLNASAIFQELMSIFLQGLYILQQPTLKICLFVLMLYVPSQQLWSWWDGQFN